MHDIFFGLHTAVVAARRRTVKRFPALPLYRNWTSRSLVVHTSGVLKSIAWGFLVQIAHVQISIHFPAKNCSFFFVSSLQLEFPNCGQCWWVEVVFLCQEKFSRGQCFATVTWLILIEVLGVRSPLLFLFQRLFFFFMITLSRVAQDLLNVTATVRQSVTWQKTIY